MGHYEIEGAVCTKQLGAWRDLKLISFIRALAFVDNSYEHSVILCLPSLKSYTFSNVMSDNGDTFGNVKSAKGYTFCNVMSAKGYTFCNVKSAKGYTFCNVMSAKGYTFCFVMSAKGYTFCYVMSANSCTYLITKVHMHKTSYTRSNLVQVKPGLTLDLVQVRPGLTLDLVYEEVSPTKGNFCLFSIFPLKEHADQITICNSKRKI